MYRAHSAGFRAVGSRPLIQGLGCKAGFQVWGCKIGLDVEFWAKGLGFRAGFRV